MQYSMEANTATCDQCSRSHKAFALTGALFSNMKGHCVVRKSETKHMALQSLALDHHCRKQAKRLA